MIHVANPKVFNELLKTNQKVVIDFWAPFCGPCKHIAPHYDQLVSEYGNTILFVKANMELDAISHLADDYNVHSIPTFIAFNSQKETARYVGANKEALTKLVQDLAQS
jgi:thioredoxin 1